MNTIYYIEKNARSQFFAEKIFAEYYAIYRPVFTRNRNGKPYLASGELFFSHTDTNGFSACAVNETAEVGIDAEPAFRQININRVARIFSPREKEEITDGYTFLLHWTAKESFIKKIGGSLAGDLRFVEYAGDAVYYKGEKRAEQIKHFRVGDYLLCLCAEDTAYTLKKYEDAAPSREQE